MKELKLLACIAIVAFGVFGVCGKTYAATGSISGTVTDVNSAPVKNAFIYLVSGGTFRYLGYTDASGNYSISNVAPGTYELRVEHYVHAYRIETGVVITANNNTVKNVTNLAAQGLIAGRITRESGGIIHGIADVIVNATSTTGFGRASKTNELGIYAIGKLPAGTYTVSAHLAGYSFNSVENVSVTAGHATRNVDFPSGGSGKISGTVTEHDGSTPIKDALVIVVDSSGNPKGLGAVTDVTGSYQVSGLPTGSYAMKVWRNTGIIGEAAGVSVTNGQTTMQNFSAPGGTGSISGSVKDTKPNPEAIVGAVVTARQNIGALTFFRAVSDSSGNYTIANLSAGTYLVTVDPNENNFAAAKIDNVTVVSGQNTSGQNFNLGSAGKISGTVKDSSNNAIVGATIIALEQDDFPTDTSLLFTFIPAETDSGGNYTINHLPSGSYIVFASANGFVSDSEQGVSVTAGHTTSNKNFSLGTTGGTISGTVYQSDGQTPISNAAVQAVCLGKSIAMALTNASGDYSITLLQSGTYTVTAVAQGYAPSTLENVTITSPNENRGNDFSLTAE